MNKQELWSRVLEELEINISRPYMESYFKQMGVDKIEGNGAESLVVLRCASAFHQIEIKRRFEPVMVPIIEKALGKRVKIDYVLGKKTRGRNNDQGPLLDFARTKTVESIEDRVAVSGLKTEYTLENFAVSSSNEMAYAAARAVAQNPGKAYNPLFLYGGVGVGKTHLMQAVGQAVLRKKMETKIIYCSGEVFTNEIIEAIRRKSTPSFRSKYRKVGMLLIDDIQFIAGKIKVQEEFFHTFNAVTGEGGQVIMTSDKQPKEIQGLEERLRSRFEGGLAIDIGSPDFELRSAILLIKARQIGVMLPTESAQEMASFVADTRAMLGLLMKVVALAQMRGEAVESRLVKEVIDKERKEGASKRGRVKPVEVINIISDHYQADPDEVRGPRRLKSLTLPRHLAMYVLKNDLKMGLVEIGRWFGNRDHTSVMHAVAKVEGLVKQTPEVSIDLEDIRKQIYS